MSINWFVVCEKCKVFKDVAQGYEGQVRPTERGELIISFLYQHEGHNLKFVSEYAEEVLEGCKEEL
jgi:hypothetical protein